MALNVTPGDPDADSYASLAEAASYASSHGLTFATTGDDEAAAEAALRRATKWIDGKYGSRFIGSPASADQALEWPRTDASFRGEALPDDVIPRQIVWATIEAAVREKAARGSLSPDLKRGGKIKSVGAGSARVEFAAGAPAETVYPTIEALLRDLARPGASGSGARYLARA